MPLTEAIDVLLEARATRQLAEVQEAVAILRVVEGYHRDLPDNPMPGRGRLVQLAAEGGPTLNEFVPLELAAALGVSQQSITLLICDLLDLEHRHPLLWDQVRAGTTPLWQARKIVARVSSIDPGLAAAREVDARLTPQLPGITLGRALKLLEGLISAIDPRGAQERAEAERRKRWIRIQPAPDGVSWIDGKLNSADGRQLDTALNRFAAILKANGDTDDRDTRRSAAIGILSNPALALALLAHDQQRRTTNGTEDEHDQDDSEPDAPTPDTTQTEPTKPIGATEATGATDMPEATEPTEPVDEFASVASPGLPAGLADLLAGIDPRKLLPKSTLVVHLSDHALHTGTGTARAEGIGPIPITQLHDLLKSTHIKVQPVFDPASITPVDSYEIPPPLRRAVLLRQPTDVFPYGATPSTGLDLDHTDPYRHNTGEPGQTRLDNLGPLTRRTHRAKTHAGWNVKQVMPGCYLWQSPLGLTYLRTADGLTYPLRTRHTGQQPPPDPG